MIIIRLPFPPTVNGLYAGKNRRYKSKPYEKWLIAARNELRQQITAQFVAAPLHISYKFGRPDKRRRDLSNLFKAPDDFLVQEGIIPDDSWIYSMDAEWSNIEGMELRISYAYQERK